MNISFKNKGFTLIELITVISIILILMGLLFPAVSSIKETAKRAQAKNDVTNLVTAVKSFYTEYGSYPNPSSSTTDMTFAGSSSSLTGTGNAALLSCLTGTSTTVNTRGIVFIEIPAVKTPATPKAGLSAGTWYDPWGTPYFVAVDLNYNNVVAAAPAYTDMNYTTSSDGLDTGVPTGVIAWSLGKDKTFGISGGKYTGSDDVISWQ